MSVPFNPAHRLIVVPAYLEGPNGGTSIRLIVDTGASRTMLREGALRSVGYAPQSAPTSLSMTTASGRITVPLLSVTKLTALGRHRTMFPVLAHNLPSKVAADGLLGLDFLRGGILTIDFRAGQINLT